jgi:hypothetical protein
MTTIIPAEPGWQAIIEHSDGRQFVRPVVAWERGEAGMLPILISPFDGRPHLRTVAVVAPNDSTTALDTGRHWDTYGDFLVHHRRARDTA